MSKKLITACMALFALAAFALPATASASPVLTHPTGTVLNPETGECTGVTKTVCITAHNIGETLLTDNNGNILARCTTATMTGYLTKNKENHITGDIHTTTFAGTGPEVGGEHECTGSFGNISVDTNLGNGTPWCLTAGGELAANEFTVRGNSCNLATRAITFVLTSTTAGACKYSRTNSIKGTYTTHSTGDATLTITAANTEFTREEGGILCPNVGRLDMTFTLETDNLNTQPIWIS